MKTFIRWLDKLEDQVRHTLSAKPRLYALVGGVAIVLFWRGVWDLADQFEFMTPWVSIIISVALMLLTGTFVSFFIGSRLLLSGLMAEKRIDEKTIEELKEEEEELELMRKNLKEIRKELSEIKEVLQKK